LTLSADTFWDFSCNLYAKQGVAQSCLSLQDIYGCNVNVLLLCVFLHEQGYALTPDQLVTIVDAITESDTCLAAHRAKRVAAKKGDPKHYQWLKQQELDLEKHQQALLINLVNQLPVKIKNHDPIEAFLAYYQLDDETKHNLVLPVKASS